MELLIIELRKVWKSKFFLLLIFAILVINGFSLFFQMREDQGVFPSSAYKRMNQELSALSMNEKKEYIDLQFEKISAIYLIDFVVSEEIMGNANSVSDLRINNSDFFTQYQDIYLANNYLNYTSTISNEYLFILEIKNEFYTVYGYQDYLESIQEKANTIQNVSIFSNNGTDFNYNNILHTASDYASMENVFINYVPQKGIVALLKNEMLDILSIVFVFFLASIIIRYEKDSDLLLLIRSTPKGRLSTGIAKVLTLAITTAVIIGSLLIINFLLLSINYGTMNIFISIQSLPFLMSSTLKVSLIEYLFLYYLFKWLTFFLIGLIAMIFCFCFSKQWIGYLGGAIFLGFSWILRASLQAVGKYSLIKYANVVSLLNTNELLGKYLNLNIKGYPQNRIIIEVLFLLFSIFLLLFLFLSLFNFFYIRKENKISPKGNLKKKNKNCFYNLFFFEAYKLAINNGGYIFLLIYMFIQIQLSFSNVSYLNANEIYYKNYVDEINGPYTVETYEKLQEFAVEFDPLVKIDNAYYNKIINESQYYESLNVYPQLVMKREAFRKISSINLRYIKTYPQAHIVYEEGYRMLFDIDELKDLSELIMISIICIFCFANYITSERSSGIIKLLRTTPQGRKITLKNKIYNLTIISVFITFFSLLPRLSLFIQEYGFERMLSPAMSLSYYNNLNTKIPIFCIVVLLIISRFLVVSCISMVVLYISSIANNFFKSISISLFILVMPLIISVIFLPSAKYFSLYPFFHATAMLNSFKNIVIVILYFSICIVLITCFKNKILQNFKYE